MAVLAWIVTCSVGVANVAWLERNAVVPTYAATTACDPTLELVVSETACPVVVEIATEPVGLESTTKLTEPVSPASVEAPFAPALIGVLGVTTAARYTGCSNAEGSADLASSVVVVVATAWERVPVLVLKWESPL